MCNVQAEKAGVEAQERDARAEVARLQQANVRLEETARAASAEVRPALHLLFYWPRSDLMATHQCTRVMRRSAGVRTALQLLGLVARSQLRPPLALFLLSTATASVRSQLPPRALVLPSLLLGKPLPNSAVSFNHAQLQSKLFCWAFCVRWPFCVRCQRLAAFQTGPKLR